MSMVETKVASLEEAAKVLAERAAQSVDTSDADTDTEATGAVETEFAPTHTVKEYEKARLAFATAVGRAVEANYDITSLACDAMDVFLGTSKDARRETLVAELARIAMEADPEADYLYPPVGKNPDTHRNSILSKRRHKINDMLHYGRTVRLLFGATSDTPVVTTSGVCAKRNTRSNVVKWQIVKQLAPLVHRPMPNDQRSDVWEIIPHVEAEAMGLVAEVWNATKTASSLAFVTDAVVRVKILSIKRSIESAPNGKPAPALTEELLKWEAKEKPVATDATATDATATDAKPDATESKDKPDAKPEPVVDADAKGGVSADAFLESIGECAKDMDKPDDFVRGMLKIFVADGLLSTAYHKAAVVFLASTAVSDATK
jgi:hypothetical protein